MNNKHGDRARLNAERKSPISRGHTVISTPTNEGTDHLRTLISEVGLRPAARLLGWDWETVARWTRKGPPEDMWGTIRRLAREHYGSNPSIPQSSGFDSQSQFNVVR